MTAELLDGRNRTDIGNKVIEELGFSMSAWNGATRPDPSAGMSTSCGRYDLVGTTNRFLLKLPSPEEAETLRLYDPAAAEEIFDTIVRTWEPDWATWTSHSLLDAQDADPPARAVGWKTFLTPAVAQEIPGLTSHTVAGGSVHSIGHNVADATEKAVLDARAQFTKCGLL